MTAGLPGLPAGLAQALIEIPQSVDDLAALLQFRDSTAQLLDLYLQPLNSSDNQAEALHGGETVRDLTIGGLRQILETIDDHLRDRELLKRSGINERIVVGVGANKRLKLRERSHYHFVDAPLAAFQACRCLNGNRKVAGDHQISTHHILPALHGLPTRYVTGAHLAVCRWLQRRAWVRRAAAIARTSDTTGTAS